MDIKHREHTNSQYAYNLAIYLDREYAREQKRRAKQLAKMHRGWKNQHNDIYNLCIKEMALSH